MLKRLLVSGIIIRTCEGMADIFGILYVTNVLGLSGARYGLLVAIQITTSIFIYVPRRAGSITVKSSDFPCDLIIYVPVTNSNVGLSASPSSIYLPGHKKLLTLSRDMEYVHTRLQAMPLLHSQAMSALKVTPDLVVSLAGRRRYHHNP